jgi:hypothetical protein
MEWLWAAVAAWFGWNIVAPFLFLFGLLAVAIIRGVVLGTKKSPSRSRGVS